MLFSSPIFRPCLRSLTIMKGVRIRGWFYNGRVGGLGLFGPKTLCPFWCGIGYGFRGNYRSVHEWTYLSFQFQMNKNEIEMCEFEMHLENFFVSALTW